MSGYMAMLCLLPAFLAAITSAFGLRAAYVRSSRAVSVSSEAAAVLLSWDSPACLLQAARVGRRP